MDIKEAVNNVFMIQGVDYPEMSVTDIALELVYKYEEFKNSNADELKNQVSRYLANDTKKKDSIYERVKNGRGGNKKGYYKLRKPKKERKPKPAIKPLEPKVKATENRMFAGTAGEMAVCSELLFREYNVARMPVDDGIDIVAMKNNKTFYIQVKTIQITSDGNFSVRISSKSFDRYNGGNCFYVIVARCDRNKYIVATANDIRRWIYHKFASQNDSSITITISQNMGSLFVKDENIDNMLDTFNIIK